MLCLQNAYKSHAFTDITSFVLLDINDHGEVCIACKPVSSKWRDLGARLGVLDTTLATIQDDYRLEGVERCMSAMISVWLRIPQGDVTNRVILTIMEEPLCSTVSY